MSSELNVALGRRGGGHSAYFNENGVLVIEWYNFGEDAPYESADMISFGEEARAAIAGCLASENTPVELLKAIAGRFTTYWEVKEWALAENIAFTHAVDFMP